jgi:hypothetical protein
MSIRSHGTNVEPDIFAESLYYIAKIHTRVDINILCQDDSTTELTSLTQKQDTDGHGVRKSVQGAQCAFCRLGQLVSICSRLAPLSNQRDTWGAN